MNVPVRPSLAGELRPIVTITALLLVITAILYPLAVTGIGQVAFSGKANGSFVTVDGEVAGSSLIGQAFVGAEYFQGRPSAAGAGYDGASSSGSNLGPSSAKLIDGVTDDPATADVDESFAGIRERVLAYRELNGLAADAVVPADAVTASASGLDPDISLANARLQAARIARERGATEADVLALIDDQASTPFLGFLGQESVNVFELNLALDEQFPAANR